MDDCITATCGCAGYLDGQTVMIDHICEMHLAATLVYRRKDVLDTTPWLAGVVTEIREVLV